MGLAPAKDTDVDVRDWLVVPIFYATNRARGANPKDIDYIEQKNNRGLFFGVKNIAVPYPSDVVVTKEAMNKMGWRTIHLDKPLAEGQKLMMPKDNLYKVPDRELAVTEVVNAFDNYRGITKSDEAVLFIHGCCATFKKTMERAAKLAAQMQIPVVVYDWVSPIGFTHYLENETLAEQTYDDFCGFLDSVAKYVPIAKTILIGHSMGGTFIDTALVRRYQRGYNGVELPKYKEIVLSQPDVDARAYLKHNKHIVSQAEKTRIFMVMNDGRLNASAMAHGHFERLGCPGRLLGDLIQFDKQDIIDMTVSGIGHELPANFIASMHRNGTINQDGYTSVLKQPHLVVLQKATTPVSDNSK